MAGDALKPDVPKDVSDEIQRWTAKRRVQVLQPAPGRNGEAPFRVPRPRPAATMPPCQP